MNAAERAGLRLCFLFFLAFPTLTGTWGIGLLTRGSKNKGLEGLLGMASITVVVRAPVEFKHIIIT